MNRPYVRLDRDDVAVLLVDHQTGLLSLVRDIEPDKFRNNVLALADMARYFRLPTILTTSFESGPNGPIVPELREQFPDAPFIAWPGLARSMPGTTPISSRRSRPRGRGSFLSLAW